MTRLAEPAQYTPWIKGLYDVAPGLRPFGTDFGNGDADRRWFQLDSRYEEFLASKRFAISESPSKHILSHNLSAQAEKMAIEVIRDRLELDYPGQFESLPQSLNELAMLVEEDLCVVRTQDARDWLAYLHVCSPSGWRPSEKIGKPFFDVHQVIPGFEKVNRAASGMVEAMIYKGPFVRFVWGVESDERLNHHPDPPLGEDSVTWKGREFSSGRFWVRTERQVIWGLPDVGAAVFTIKVGHVPDEQVMANPKLHKSLIAALHSMSREAREYKGLTDGWDDLMILLKPTD